MQDRAFIAAPDEAALAREIAAAPPGMAAAAEAQLCRRLAPRIRLYGLRHLRDAHAAADLVQNVLVMMLERLRAGKVRDLENLGSFVFGMCRRVVLDMRRGIARRQRLLEQFYDTTEVEDSEVGRRLDERRLAGCLQRLSERERLVIVLTFYGDKSAGEVARQLDLSEGNVRVIRHRAMQRLRHCVTGGGRAGVSACVVPVSQATLLEYWLGELSVEAEAGVEAHFLACAHCSAQLGELVAIGNGVRALAPRGAAPLFATRSLLEGLRREGIRVREYRLAPGESVQCTLHAEDDLLVSRLQAPLAGVTRLDFVRIGKEGESRLPDIPFAAAAGEVIFLPPMAVLRALGRCTERVLLVSVTEAGERALGEYTFHHSPSGGLDAP